MPTEAQAQALISRIIILVDDFRIYIGDPVTAGTFFEDLNGAAGVKAAGAFPEDFDFGENVLNAFAQGRATLDSFGRQGAQFLLPAFLEYAKVLGFVETDIPSIFRRLRQDFRDNSKLITSRGLTLPQPIANANNISSLGVQDGVITRVNFDEFGSPIENQTPDGKQAICIRDRHSGAVEHEEFFEIQGQTPEIDLLRIIGSGRISEIKALSARDSQQFVSNPSFSDFSGPITAPTGITDWEPSVPNVFTNFRMEQTDPFRGFEGDTTPTAVVFLDNETLTQDLSTRRAQFSRDIPFYLQIAVQRQGVADGSIVLRLGQESVTITLASLTAGNWTAIRLGGGLGAPTVAADARRYWYQQFNDDTAGNALELEIEVVGNTTGGGVSDVIFVDDIVLAPFSLFDGGYYAVVGGDEPFRAARSNVATSTADEFQWADTLPGVEGVVARWIWRLFNEYLPTGLSTWSEEPAAN